jgi:hypothetical protein
MQGALVLLSITEQYQYGSGLLPYVQGGFYSLSLLPLGAAQTVCLRVPRW